MWESALQLAVRAAELVHVFVRIFVASALELSPRGGEQDAKTATDSSPTRSHGAASGGGSCAEPHPEALSRQEEP